MLVIQTSDVSESSQVLTCYQSIKETSVPPDSETALGLTGYLHAVGNERNCDPAGVRIFCNSGRALVILLPEPQMCVMPKCVVYGGGQFRFVDWKDVKHRVRNNFFAYIVIYYVTVDFFELRLS